MNDYVYALAVSGTNLYVGGAFSTAGGVPGVSASRIAASIPIHCTNRGQGQSSNSEAPVQNKYSNFGTKLGEFAVTHLGGQHAAPNTLSLQPWPGRWDGCGTLSGTDKNSKSLGKHESGTVGRLYTPKAPPPSPAHL